MNRGWMAIVALVLALSPVPAFAALLPVHAQVRYWAGFVPGVTLTGSGVGNSVGGGIATIPSGLFANRAAVSVPISPSFVGITNVTAPASSIDNPSGAFGPNGVMGLTGSMFFNSGAGGYVPLSPIGGGGFVRLGANIGGLVPDVAGATWMGGTQVFSAMLAALAVPISARETAYDNRTAGGAGTVQLVAPARLIFGAFGSLPIFGVLTLTYTPEPGTLTLLGAGVATLAAIGRRKQPAARRG